MENEEKKTAECPECGEIMIIEEISNPFGVCDRCADEERNEREGQGNF